MQTCKIFLASSEELLDDRKAFETFLYRKSIDWVKERKLFLELKVWENFIDAMSTTRLQDEYDKAIGASDIFVMLFWTKVGKYSEEEFDVASSGFQRTGKPLIYTYFKEVPSSTALHESLSGFRGKLKNMQHFETPYKSTEGLLLHFNSQLDKLYNANYLSAESRQSLQNANKEEILKLIDKGELFVAFEELSKQYAGNNLKLNALIDEFVNPPNNHNPVQFATRLKVFVNQN
jgi:hypothetical protein